MSRYSYDSVTDTLKLISGATQANDIYISGIEESSTASQAYTVGSYLIYSKVLYKVILAIAQGDTLTPGTNIQSTRVADEINSHLCVDGNEFYFDSHDGVFGYNTSPSRGADTFSPFRGIPIISVKGSGTGGGYITSGYTLQQDFDFVIGCVVTIGTSGTINYSGTGTTIGRLNCTTGEGHTSCLRAMLVQGAKSGGKFSFGGTEPRGFYWGFQFE